MSYTLKDYKKYWDDIPIKEEDFIKYLEERRRKDEENKTKLDSNNDKHHIKSNNN